MIWPQLMRARQFQQQRQLGEGQSDAKGDKCNARPILHSLVKANNEEGGEVRPTMVGTRQGQ